MRRGGLGRLFCLVVAGVVCACETTTIEPDPEPETPEPPPPANTQRDTVTAMTFNILHDAGRGADQGNIPEWAGRRDLVARTIDAADADVVGLQEAYMWQVEWLEEQLPQYEYFGRGRDADGGDESVAILYRGDRLTREESGHFWLSPTPSQPGSTGGDGWGGMRTPRIVSWVRLEIEDSGRAFYVYNTHLPSDDTGGERARRRSVLVLSERIAERSELAAPFLLLGDLNATRNDFPLRYLRREVPACDGAGCPDPPPFSRVAVIDTWRAVNPGEEGTRCRNDASGERVPAADGDRIDHVLASGAEGDDESASGWEVLSSTHFVLGSSCASDHVPVLTRMVLPDP